MTNPSCVNHHPAVHDAVAPRTARAVAIADTAHVFDCARIGHVVAAAARRTAQCPERNSDKLRRPGGRGSRGLRRGAAGPPLGRRRRARPAAPARGRRSPARPRPRQRPANSAIDHPAEAVAHALTTAAAYVAESSCARRCHRSAELIPTERGSDCVNFIDHERPSCP